MSDKAKKVSEDKVRKDNPTLADRGAVYGNYHEGVVIRHNLMTTLKKGFEKEHNTEMPAKYQEYLWDICNKLSRIAKCPNHLDSWHDIAGYAQLTENAIKESGEGV